jgi:GTP-binding protein
VAPTRRDGDLHTTPIQARRNHERAFLQRIRNIHRDAPPARFGSDGVIHRTLAGGRKGQLGPPQIAAPVGAPLDLLRPQTPLHLRRDHPDPRPRRSQPGNFSSRHPPAAYYYDLTVPEIQEDRIQSWHSPDASMSPPLPTVVIVGRPNVGKSTLFNRITGSRRAIVGNEPGITRDRLHLPAAWGGRRFEVIDTGGILIGEEAEIPAQILKQARSVIQQAAHLIFVIDGRTEITGADRELAALLLRTGRPVSLAVNKIDAESRESLVGDFYRLGIRDVFPISSEHGRGVAELLDHVTETFPSGEAAEVPRPIHVAIIGKPNAGKSTLLNRLAGAERAIVSEVPGTTRDAVDALVERGGVRYNFVDTAGIRRKGKTRLMAEKLSVVMARRHIRLADVVLLLIDAAEGVTALDATIAGYAHESGKPVVIVVNKWDVVSQTEKTDRFTEQIRDNFKFLEYAPVAFISALKGSRIERLFPLLQKAYQAAHRRIPTGELNRFFAGLDLGRAPMPAGQQVKILYLTQASVAPPTFVLFTDRSRKLHFSFERFLINQLRRRFDFQGTPVVIRTRAKR